MPRRLHLSLAALLVLAVACSDGPPANRAPTVTVAGPSEVKLGESISLVATGADADGNALTYKWAVVESPSGSKPGLTGATSATASFTPDREGQYVVGVSVKDGQLESPPATIAITAVKQAFISGRVTVRVVDAAEGKPIVGATVAVAGTALSATTTADGSATIVDASLTGAVTLHVRGPGTVKLDHDLDPATPEVERPRWRGATLQGAIRSELTVPLHASGASKRAAATGSVKGAISDELFALLPEVTQLLSFNTREVTSGQIRAVLIAPLPEKAMADLAVSDLMGRPLSPTSLLPGNLGTDDAFLNSMGALLGLPASLGPRPLTNFEVRAKAGKQPFFVIGGLVSIDTPKLVPLISGRASADPGAILGSMELTTLFLGVIELDVPAGDTLTLGAPLAPSDFKHLWKVDADVQLVTSRGPWAFGPETEVEFEKAVVTPKQVAQVGVPARLADPRVAANLPDSAPIELLNADGSRKTPRDWEWLDVPADTGEVKTDAPYSFTLAAASVDGRLYPIGIAFTRVGDIERTAPKFALPKLDGPLASARLEALALGGRGVRPSPEDNAYDLLPGQAAAALDLAAGANVTPPAPAALPQTVLPEDAGLLVNLEFTREDHTTAVVQSARALVVSLTLPSRVRHELGAEVKAKLPATAHLAHAVLTSRKWVTVGEGDAERDVPIDDARWDVYADAAATTTLALPPAEGGPFAPGEQLLVEVRAETFAAPLNMELWSGERVRQGPRAFSQDAWLAYWP